MLRPCNKKGLLLKGAALFLWGGLSGDGVVLTLQQTQAFGVVPQMVVHEGLDEVVAVVVAGVLAQRQGLA